MSAAVVSLLCCFMLQIKFFWLFLRNHMFQEIFITFCSWLPIAHNHLRLSVFVPWIDFSVATLNLQVLKQLYWLVSFLKQKSFHASNVLELSDASNVHALVVWYIL